MKIGCWEILHKSTKGGYVCKCECGIRKRFTGEELKSITDDTKCEHKIPNRKDISGMNFGAWHVIKPTSKGYYLCKCNCGCGTVKEIYGTTLRNGKTKSCGKNTTGFKDLTGKKFGSLVVQEYEGNHIWKCLCDCGNYTSVHRYSLISGKTKSCGCKSSDLAIKTLINNKKLSDRSKEQLEAIKNKSSLKEYIVKLGYKPTILQLSNSLGINRAWTGHYIHKYKLEEYVSIDIPKSTDEIELCNYIKSITDCNVIESDRTVLNGYELDIYIPELKLAIEYNGTYWHSDIFKDKYYHQHKTIECAKKNIRLIHIFEYEYNTDEKKENIHRFLYNIINRDSHKIIYGRNTEVKEIDSYEARGFIEKYHLQSYSGAKINIGCYYNNELVSVLTFGEPRFNKKYQYEIIRYCNKDDVAIVGGIEKMFKYFIKNYKPESIITYSDLSKFTGNVYTKLGMKIIGNGITGPSYVWVEQKKDIILPRYKTQKHRLIELGLGTEEESESDIMRNNGFLKVYNCGNIKLEYRVDNSM